jgi:hypothetical protein
MKAVRTSVTAWVVLPRIKCSILTQITSYTSPANPEAKNRVQIMILSFQPAKGMLALLTAERYYD